MAYRSADYERWKELDFVVGIEIRTSNNHTTKDSTGKTVGWRTSATRWRDVTPRTSSS